MMADADAGPGTPARFCYVLLCHDDAPAVLSLVRAVRRLSPAAQVLVRHDRPTGYLDEAEVTVAGGHLLRSATTVRWGAWSLVEAMLEAADHAVRRLGATHVVLVSGQDRPVRDLAAWEGSVVAAGVDALLDVDPRPDHDRHRYRWWTWTRPARTPDLLARASRRLWQAAAARTGGRISSYPTSRPGVWAVGLRRRRDELAVLGLRYTKGSQWMTLSAAAVAVATGAETATARALFRRVRIPDESYVQTVVTSDPQLVVRPGATTHAVFPFGAASPRAAVPGDVTVARARGAAFLRKVSSGSADAATVQACEASAHLDPTG